MATIFSSGVIGLGWESLGSTPLFISLLEERDSPFHLCTVHCPQPSALHPSLLLTLQLMISFMPLASAYVTGKEGQQEALSVLQTLISICLLATSTWNSLGFFILPPLEPILTQTFSYCVPCLSKAITKPPATWVRN